MIRIDTYWTGVGTRGSTELPIPPITIRMMHSLGKRLTVLGWVLRSGAANGSDTHFEEGCDMFKLPDYWEPKRKQIFLPFQGFNGKSGIVITPQHPKFHEAYEIASKIHPNWKACINQRKAGQAYSFAELAHTRNVFQVLGQDIDIPSKILIAYTHGGGDVGGTRTAIVLARSRDIPVFNLYNQVDRDNLLKLILEEEARLA